MAQDCITTGRFPGAHMPMPKATASRVAAEQFTHNTLGFPKMAGPPNHPSYWLLWEKTNGL